MEITCVNCQQTWKVSPGQLLAAKIRFGLGFVDHPFTCPNCHTKNIVPATEYKKSDHPSPFVPVTGDQAQLDIQSEHYPPRAENDGAPAPTNPEPGPKETSNQVQAVVIERGLSLLREPNPMSETMAKLHKGEKITILNTWTDGEETWVQLGPERWAVIEQDGKVMIELLNN